MRSVEILKVLLEKMIDGLRNVLEEDDIRNALAQAEIECNLTITLEGDSIRLSGEGAHELAIYLSMIHLYLILKERVGEERSKDILAETLSSTVREHAIALIETGSVKMLPDAIRDIANNMYMAEMELSAKSALSIVEEAITPAEEVSETAEKAQAPSVEKPHEPPSQEEPLPEPPPPPEEPSPEPLQPAHTGPIEVGDAPVFDSTPEPKTPEDVIKEFMKYPRVTERRARKLYNSGITSIRDLRLMNINEISIRLNLPMSISERIYNGIQGSKQPVEVEETHVKPTPQPDVAIEETIPEGTAIEIPVLEEAQVPLSVQPQESQSTGTLSPPRMDNGFSIPRNGKARGGLINGHQRRRTRVKYKEVRRRRGMVAVAVILFLLVVTFFSVLVFQPQIEPITIDGKFDDWEGKRKAADTKGDGGAADIVEYSMVESEEYVYFYVRFAAPMFKGKWLSENESIADSLRIFLDVDRSSNSGYVLRGLGAEYMLHLAWVNDTLVVNSLMEYAGGGLDFQWRAISSVAAKQSVDQAEIGTVRGSRFAGASPWVTMHEKGWNGSEDYTDLAIADRASAFLINVDIMLPRVIKDTSFQVMVLNFMPTKSGTKLDEVRLAIIGDASIVTKVSATLSGKVYTGVITGANVSLSIHAELSTSANVGITAEVSQKKAETPFGLKVLDIRGDAPATLKVNGDCWASYFDSLPSGINVDGALGEWGALVDDSASNVKPNNDIMAHQIIRDQSSTSFILKVEGEMMGGTGVPVGATWIIAPSQPGNASKPQAPIGEDRWRIYLGSKNDTSGEYSSRFDFYTKWKIEMTGKNGAIIESRFLRYDLGQWSNGGSLEVEIALQSMELQVQISDGYLVGIESVDWGGKSVDNVTAQSNYDSPSGPSILATTVDLPAMYDVTVTRSAACTNGGATYGRENYSHIDVGTNGTKCGRGILRFSLSSIPRIAVISSVALIVYVLADSTNTNHRTNVRRIIDDPLSATDTTLFGDAGTGSRYLQRSTFLASGTGTGWKSLSLGGTVVTDLTSALTPGWFALGLQMPNNRPFGQIASREYSGGGYVTILRVTYSIPSITVGLGSTAPASVYQGQTDIVMGSFTLALNTGIRTVTMINITRFSSATGADADVSSVRIYNDTNGDGAYGTGDALLAPQSTLTAGVARFSLSMIISSVVPVRIFVLFNISASATPFNKDGAMVSQSVDIKVSNAMVLGTPVAMGDSLINARVMQVSVGSFSASSVVYCGDNNVVMGQLRFIMNWGNDIVTSVTLTRYTASTGSDLDITSVRLFYDSNNDGSIAGETQIDGSRTLAAGKVTFPGISVPVDSTNGVRILVVANISASATLGNSDGFMLQVQGDISSTYAKSGSFPVRLGASVIDRRVVNVALGGFTAPSVVPQGLSAVMGQFELWTNNGTDTVTSITISRYGLSSDADVSSVRLFFDSNNDGSIAGETRVGAQMTFSSGSATFSGLSLSIGTTKTRLLVVFNISVSAMLDDTLGGSIASAASITASSFPVSGSFPVQMGLSKVISTALMVAKGGFDAPAAVYQGAQYVVMGQFTLRMSSGSDTVMQINVTRYGNSSDPDVSSVRLFYDSNNDGNIAGETQIGGQLTFSSGVARFTGIFVPVTSAMTRVLVVFNFSASATVGAMLGAGIRVSADVRTSTYQVSGTFPVQMGECVVRGTLLISAGGFTAPGSVYQGSHDVVMGQNSLRTNDGTTTVTRINVTRYSSGTGADTDVSSVRLFYDSNNDGSIAGETQIGTQQVFAGGVASFGGIGVGIGMAQTRILIVFNYSNSATVGNNDGARIALSTDVESVFIRSGAFPISLGTSTIIANSLRVSLGAFTAPAQMFQGQTDLVMGQFTMNTSAGLDTVTGIVITRYTAGAGADTDFASVRLYYDSNNDGSIAGESRIGIQQVFAGGTATFPGLAIAVGAVPVRILVVVNVSGTAPIGNNDGCRIAASGSVMAASFPVVGAFSVNMGTSTVTARRLLVSDPDGPNPPPPVYTTDGDANVLMGRLRLAMNYGTDTVTGLTVTWTGNGANGDVAAVRIFYDVNGNGIADVGDQQLDVDQVFGGGGTATFAFSLSVSTVPKYILIVYDFLGGIVDGTTEGASINAAADITVTSTGISGSFPILFGNTIIRSTTLTVALDGFSAPANAYQGDANVVMGQFALGMNTGTATVVQINVTRYSTGSGSDSDITQVRLFYDSNNDGSISGETQIGSTVALTSGMARFTSLSVSISTTPVRVLVVYDFSSSATVGNRDGARVSIYTDLRPSTPIAVTGSFPVNMGETTILATEMNVAVGSYTAPGTVYRAQISVVMGQFTLSMNHASDTVTQIKVTRYGTATDQNVTSVRIFYDSNDDGSISSEVQIGTEQAFSSSVATFSSLSIPIGTSVTRILVVYNVSGSAAPGATIGASIVSPNDITSTHAKVGTFPVQLGLSTIIGLSVSGVDHAPASASPGTTDLLMLELIFSTVGGSIDVDTIKVTHTGIGAPGDVTSVKLYLDNGDGTYNSGSDTLLGSGTYSGGSITFGIVGVSMFTASPGVSRRVFIVCDFSGTASGTHGVRVADISSITTVNAGPVSGSYPFNSTETSFVPEIGGQAVAATLTVIALLIVLRRKRRITP